MKLILDSVLVAHDKSGRISLELTTDHTAHAILSKIPRQEIEMILGWAARKICERAARLEEANADAQ